MRLIEITISHTGQTTVQTRGFAGNSCRQASLFLEAALGSRTAEQLTPEFHQSAAASQPQQQTSGRA